ncbi:hydroxyalkanoic acid synthase [Halalkalibacter okhensis]|uniref:Hydroxyalkanoic acid synthase n=1 Tax=Halalkalibacter okhensis TaxID=333138 RepID=A0A0B0IFB8_9BACI|nr:hydroxyalkanoic acid synthase [Halalkalibacter okhensis]
MKRWRGIQNVLFEPEPQYGQTNKELIWKKNKSTLWYYPSSNKKYRIPLFLIYSLMNESYILDLAPGLSMIEAFTKEGYDVYLLDFGKPGYEDNDITLDDYILTYIEKGVQRALLHAKSNEISIVGYCLGGTLATIYTALAKEPIRNLILFAPPINFSDSPWMPQWFDQLKNNKINVDDLLGEYGVIPAKIVGWGMRLATSPFTYSSYLSLVQRADHPDSVRKWRLFNRWVNGHIPFSGATLKKLINDIIRDNKLINNELIINQQPVLLSNINANLLLISTSGDQLVPENLSLPLIKKVSSPDKLYKRVKGGHVTLAMTGEIPEFLQEWLSKRSEEI